MDLKGTLVDTKLRIHPTKKLIEYIESISIENDTPLNITRLVKGKDYEPKQKDQLDDTKIPPVYLNSKDINKINKIKAKYPIIEKTDEIENIKNIDDVFKNTDNPTKGTANKKKNKKNKTDTKEESNQKDAIENQNEEKHNSETSNEIVLSTSDLDWLYSYLSDQRQKGVKNVPYLHVLLEGAIIETPENEVIKRNPVLEARCVKLRAQQEAREYRKMTKTVDNVRMRFPEDSISYQLKQMNRQMIAIGQFIISIFAGFLFGFRGVEWMVGNLDFGFRLLLGVMCALVIALAEIYFLAKKLNEELNVPETIQLGGPIKFAEEPKRYDAPVPKKKAVDKEHQE